MARTAITPTPTPGTGLNLTDAPYATLGVGPGNGVAVVYSPSCTLVFKNTTGGPATFDIKTPTPAAFAESGITIPDVAVVVANGKIWLYPLSSIFIQPDGGICVDCDVAAQVLYLG